MFQVYKFINNIIDTNFESKYTCSLPFDYMTDEVYNNIISLIYTIINSTVINKEIDMNVTNILKYLNQDNLNIVDFSSSVMDKSIYNVKLNLENNITKYMVQKEEEIEQGGD
jgi:hypothetical protein